MSQMVIQVNKEGGEAVAALADIALKVGGLSNLQKVSLILSCVKMIEEAPAETPKVVKFPGRRPDLEVEPLRGEEARWEDEKPAEEKQ